MTTDVRISGAGGKSRPIYQKPMFPALLNPENCMVVPRWMRNKRRLPRLRSPREVFPVFPKFRSPSRRGSPPAGRTRLCTAGSAPDGGTTSRRETITYCATSHAIGGTSGSGKVRMSFRSLARHSLPERQAVPPESQTEHFIANSATSNPVALGQSIESKRRFFV